MKTVKPDSLSLLYASLPLLPGFPADAGECTLSLGALLGFPCQEQGEMTPLSEQQLWQVVEEALPEGETLDMGLPKPRSEFLVYGACHAPQPVRGREVIVQVAGLRKELHVYGDRFDTGPGQSAPAPFSSMPLTWKQAYGGAQYAGNPEGKGHAPLPDGSRPLPNVEDARAPVTSQGGRGLPVGLTSIPPHWPQRSRHLGPLDAAWFSERWPGLPEGTSMEYACCAPEDQRLQSFFQGGETFAVAGMHPGRELVQGVVPPVRGRIFVLRTLPEGGDTFEEVPCRLETLWIFPAQEAGLLLCRGVTSTRDEECEDIAAVLLAMEDAGTPPEDSAHYERLCRESLEPAQPPAPTAPPEPAAASAPRAEVLGAAIPTAAAATQAMGMEQALPAQPMERLEESVAAIERDVRRTLEDNGLSWEQAEQGLEARLAESRQAGDPELAGGDPMQRLQTQVEEIESQVGAFLQEQGLDREELQRRMAEQQELAAEERENFLQGLRELEQDATQPAEVRSEVGKILAAAAQVQAVLQQLGGLAGPAGVQEQGPASEPKAPEIPPMSAPLRTEQALERLRSGKGLADCDLRQCDFSGQDIAGADLRRALLQGVRWQGVRLERALLAGAMCQDADLTDAVLDGADCADAVFQNATLAGCSARECRLQRAQLQDAVLAGADLEAADLGDADASGADLTGASLHRLQGANCRLSGARLAGLHIDGARLQGSRADAATDMSGARFENCSLDAVCWGGARLSGARFADCSMDAADLAKADLRGARLTRVSLRQGVLLKADLTRAILRGVNLFRASLRRADCTSAGIEDANLFGADLYRVRLDLERLQDVNLERTLLDPETTGGGRG